MDVEELLGLIRGKRYFVLHAPHQTGRQNTIYLWFRLCRVGEYYSVIRLKNRSGIARMTNMARRQTGRT